MEDEYLELYSLQKQKKKLSSRSTTRKDFLELSGICNRCGEILFHQGKFNEALKEHEAEEAACSAANDILGIANAHRRIGECYAELGNFNKATEHQQKHLDLSVEANSLLEQQRAWATIGRTHLYQSEAANSSGNPLDNNLFRMSLNRAEEAFRKSLDICSKLTLSDVIPFELEQMKGRLYLNLGLVMDQRNEMGECVRFINQAIDIHTKQSQWDDLYRSHHSLSLIYLKQRDTSNGLEHAETAIKIALRLKDVEKEHEIYLHKGRILLHDERYGEAKIFLRKCYKLSQATGEEIKLVKRLLKIASSLDAEKKMLDTTDASDIGVRLTIYEKLGDLCSSAELYRSAIEYYQLALTNSKLLGNSDEALAPLYVSLAQTFVDDSQYKKALMYYRLELDCWTNNLEEKCRTLLNVADCESRLHSSYEKVVKLYNDALIEARISENRVLQKQCLKSLADYQLSVGKIDDKEVTLVSLEDYNNVVSSDEDTNGDSNESSLFLSDSDVESDKESSKSSKTVNRSRKTNFLQIRKNEKGETPLHRACIAGQLNIVKRLIEQGHPVNVRDNSGWLPIHEAANHGYADICQYLLEKGATVNDRGGDHCEGITPLHDAALNCNLDVMEVLFEHGASFLAKNNHGMTPLDCLSEWRKTHKHEADAEYLAASLAFEEKIKRKLELVQNVNDNASTSSNNSDSAHRQTSRINTEDSDTDQPAVVPEENVQPACDNWIIDDIGMANTSERKRRKYDLLSFVDASKSKTSHNDSNFKRDYKTRSRKSPPKKTYKIFETRKRKRSVDNFVSPPSSPVEVLGSIESQIILASPEHVDTVSVVDVITRVNVKVFETTFLIPVPKGETIKWLNNEAAQRYYLFSGQKPKLVLTVGDGNVELSPDDKVEAVIRPGEEVLGNFQTWDITSIEERYCEACNFLKLENQESVRRSLVKAESCFLADFSKFKMESMTCTTVLRSFQGLRNLCEINFSGNYFEQQELQILASLLKSLPFLKALDISNCEFSDSTLLYVVDHLKHKPVINIEILKIGYNPILDEGCKNLHLFFQCLPQLTTLSIPSISTSTTISQDCFGREFVNSLTKLHNLQKLDLSFTKFSTPLLLEIIAIFPQMKLLELDLTSVVHKSDSISLCYAMRDWLQDPTTVVKILRLSMCFLNDDCIQILCFGLRQRKLDLLDLLGNPDLTDSSVKLLQEIMPMDQLKLTFCPMLQLTTTSCTKMEETFEDFVDWDDDDDIKLPGSPTI